MGALTAGTRPPVVPTATIIGMAGHRAGALNAPAVRRPGHDPELDAIVQFG